MNSQTVPVGRCDVLIVPLDDRPCTRDFAAQLAPLVGWTTVRPPDALLGWFTRAGDTGALTAWLREALGHARHAVLSVDMLVFGGLVASRAFNVDAPACAARVEELGLLLASCASASVDAFSVLMRVPPLCTSDDERLRSERLLKWSRLTGRADLAANPLAVSVLRGRARKLADALPEGFLDRYRRTRARNHAVNQAALRWAEQGLVRFALIGMDDSRTEGCNVSERRLLEPVLACDRSDLLPGTDEVAMLLLARHAVGLAGRRLRVAVHTSPDTFAARFTRYEDRSVEALLEAHARVLGISLVEEGHDADLDLFVNGCAGRQQEAAVQCQALRPSRRHWLLARRIARALERGHHVAVADLGYANGGDLAFVQALEEAVELPRLAAYAAWNTAGNTVGTVLAHAVLRVLGADSASTFAAQLSSHALEASTGGLSADSASTFAAEEAHQRFLFERFVDDAFYQASVRQDVARVLAEEGANPYALGDRHEAVQRLVGDRLGEIAHGFFDRAWRGRSGRLGTVQGPLVFDARLPWPRIFEVALETRFGLA